MGIAADPIGRAHLGPYAAEQPEHVHGFVSRAELLRVILVGVAATMDWAGIMPRFGGTAVLTVAVVAAGGYPVFREAVENLLSRRMTMELSMTLALAAALAIRRVHHRPFHSLLRPGSRDPGGMTVDRGRKAIQNLLDLLPKTALVRRGETIQELAIHLLNPGDVVVIRPAAEIPVDGVVLLGHSTVDQSSITGESVPVDKLPGAPVFAGTINQSGMLEVSTEKLGADTIFGRIIDAVEKAEQSRAPIQRIADRMAAWLVYLALASALLTFALTHNIRSAIAVIIVAGACGIAAGTPLAILGAIGRAAQQGAIVKGGRHMEALGTIDSVVLDKTGTLTFGEPYVVDVIACPGVDPRKVVEFAAIAERPSEHPLAKAILRESAHLGSPIQEPQTFEYLPGKGIRCTWNSEEILVGNRALMSDLADFEVQRRSLPNDAGNVLVAYRGELIGALRVEDALRPEAVEAVKSIRDMGVEVMLLTGDRHEIAGKVARQLGVTQFGAELLPEQKLHRVEELMASGKRVAMVGDGINDAPALARATVGIAMGSGTELARQSASVLLLGNHLLDFAELLNTARRCRRIILFNFAGTLAVDGLGIVLAAMGILSPLLAAFLHISSEMAFILNSARLVPASGRRS